MSARSQLAPRKISRQTIPLWVKLGYTGFMIILVPSYLRVYGPTNFLYFCDVALLLTLVALWLENSLLASAAIVGILVPQLLWMLDFMASLTGYSLTGATEYMFNAAIPFFTRLLSFFHFWLPLFLLWAVTRLGYDRRAFKLWTVLASLVLIASYLFSPPPPPPPDNRMLPVNVNYVYGPSSEYPQEWMHPLLYLFLMLTLLPSVLFWPTHLVLSKMFHAPDLPSLEMPKV